MLSAFSIAVAWAVLMLSLAAAASRHAEILNNPPPGVQFTIPRGIAPKSPWLVKHNSQTSVNVQKIHGTPAKANSRSAAAILGAHRRQIWSDAGHQNITSTTTETHSSSYGIQYSVQVLWDKMPLSLMLDTASSDTWAVDKDFECVNLDYDDELYYREQCGFGPTYNGSFQYGKAAAPELYMHDRYSDRNAPLFATGPMGYSDITLGNITVTKQLVGLANRTRWDGDNLVSGVMGLAFPSLTNAFLEYNGSSHFNGTGVPRREYSPLFQTMIEQRKSAPMFTMAIDRGASTGLLAWGGVPDLPGVDWNKTASLDMVITNLTDRPNDAQDRSFYTVVADGWHFANQTHNQTDNCHHPYIVDTGTTPCYLPSELALAINQVFNPPAEYVDLYTFSGYYTSCDAVPPSVSIILDGIRFEFDPKDMLYRDEEMDHYTDESRKCATAFNDGGVGPFILGGSFMQNAVVQFDVGNAQIHFAPRTY